MCIYIIVCINTYIYIYIYIYIYTERGDPENQSLSSCLKGNVSECYVIVW